MTKKILFLAAAAFIIPNFAGAYSASITLNPTYDGYEEILFQWDFGDITCQDFPDSCENTSYIFIDPAGYIGGAGTTSGLSGSNVWCSNNPAYNFCDSFGQHSIIIFPTSGNTSSLADDACENSQDLGACQAFFSTNGIPFEFLSIIVGERSIINNNEMFQVPTSTATALTAAVSDTLSDPGMLAVIGVVVGIPFAFYVIRKLISLVPKR